MKRYPQCYDCKYLKKTNNKDVCTRFFQGRFLDSTMIIGICKYYKTKRGNNDTRKNAISR